MCGITGIFSNSKIDRLEDSIYKMSDSLVHRGPDDSGVWINREDGVALAHKRLSIIDLSSAGHQPIVSPCGRFTVVFNGEIYNHMQLRKQLNNSKYNQVWQGHSDTETLVSAFSQWGIEKTLPRLIGMFAIAIWDNAIKNLFLVRDRFGEKPLYYGWNRNTFLFGSELKAIRCYNNFDNIIDRDALSCYMQYMYVPTPYSIYKNIYKLEPGCILQINKDGLLNSFENPPFSPFNSKNISIKQWYSLSDIAKNGQKNVIEDENEAIDLLEKTLLKSVRLQLATDVPLGAFLSGGIDSSLIVSLMQKISNKPIKTFTIGFKEKAFNEAIYAKEVANYLGTNHSELYVTSDDAYKVIPELPILYDEPFADSSQIPTFLVSKLAHDNVTVSLSGDAGDELFGGYNRYLWGENIWSKIKWMPLNLRRVIGSAISTTPISVLDAIGDRLPNRYKVSSMGSKAHRMASRFKNVNSIDDLYHSLVVERYKENSLVYRDNNLSIKNRLDNLNIASDLNDPEHRMMLWDSLTYLPDDILTKVDRAAMGVSLETRIPFLDNRVVELAWRLPLTMKIKNGKGKWPLRQILNKYVPRELVERPKAGFAVPVGQWIRGPLNEWSCDLLNDSRIKSEGYFNPDSVKEVWGHHINGTHDHTSTLWALLMFQAWLEKNK